MRKLSGLGMILALSIPAIEHPVFVTGKEAMAQVEPEASVLGVVPGGELHAYSLWQLNATDRRRPTP